MKLVVLFCFLAIELSFGNQINFQSETDRVTKVLNCKQPDITPASSGFGALYGCITGNAQTVKFFINEVVGTGKVENIKLMWNDYFANTGFGIHADNKEALNYVKALSKLYAPTLEEKLLSIFLTNNDTTFELETFHVKYTFKRGPAIDERLFVLTPKKIGSIQEPTHKSSNYGLKECIEVVAKAAGYADTFLTGDGEPIKEKGYISYMIKGRGKDMFFCEIYTGGHYKIKAALNGKYPFIYIANGSF